MIYTLNYYWCSGTVNLIFKGYRILLTLMYFWDTYSLVINWTPSLAANCYLCCFAFYHIYGSCYVKQLFLFFWTPYIT